MNNDLEIRNNKYGMDCLRELYSDESLLPTNLRLPIHESELDRPTINQQYRAIVLGEYERLYSDATRDFIEKKVSYPEYLRKVKEYTRFANELWI